MWKYRARAEQLAAENPDLTADNILAAFLSIPVRLWDFEGRGSSRVAAANLAGQSVSSTEELLNIFKVIHTGGFISWDEQPMRTTFRHRATPRTRQSRGFFVHIICPPSGLPISETDPRSAETVLGRY